MFGFAASPEEMPQFPPFVRATYGLGSTIAILVCCRFVSAHAEIIVVIGLSTSLLLSTEKLIRKEITNKTIRSFLYYVPYVTLAVMTFPAITETTQTPLSGLLALVAGIVLAWVGVSLFGVAVVSCLVVLIAEFFLV